VLSVVGSERLSKRYFRVKNRSGEFNQGSSIAYSLFGRRQFFEFVKVSPIFH